MFIHDHDIEIRIIEKNMAYTQIYKNNLYK
jgi:hypothetical protein